MIHPTQQVIQWQGREIVLHTGHVARQALGAVMVHDGDARILCTVTAGPVMVGGDFFPLSVHYVEKAYAGGKIPGGFVKREAKPSDHEILVSRLIDRALRPLFASDFLHEVQVVCTVLSADEQADLAIDAIVGASAALALSGLPIKDVVGAIRVGYDVTHNGGSLEGESLDWHPDHLLVHAQARGCAALDLVIAGTAGGVIMVECAAKEQSETFMVQAMGWAHHALQPVIAGIKALAAAAGTRAPFRVSLPKNHEHVGVLRHYIHDQWGADLQTLCNVQDRVQRRHQLAALCDHVCTAISEEGRSHSPQSSDGHNAKMSAQDHCARTPDQESTFDQGGLQIQETKRSSCAADAQQMVFPYQVLLNWPSSTIKAAFFHVWRTVVRKFIATSGKRLDGRLYDQVRPIACQTQFLPRTHGSALFTRGQTQALVAVTLGAKEDAQAVDTLEGAYRDAFMVHYNFPPYSVGESGKMSGPGRREIGHGKLAWRALKAVMPMKMPYTVRVVSEILESYGSSSMATVCAASLALQDAGVPMTNPVAGIAMGLVQWTPDEERFDRSDALVTSVSCPNSSAHVAHDFQVHLDVPTVPHSMDVENNFVTPTQKSAASSSAPQSSDACAMQTGVPSMEDRSCEGIVLSDISGLEDALGDMDFKVAGTEKGITALQMDLKGQPLSQAFFQDALAQARLGRLHILQCMAHVSKPHAQDYDRAGTPVIVTTHVAPDRLRELIGPGGRIIKELCESTRARIDLGEDGVVTVFAPHNQAAQNALSAIQRLMSLPEEGTIYLGNVVKVMDFGVFVNFGFAQDGIVHVSEIADTRIDDINNVLSVGDKVTVKMIGFDRGRPQLSIKRV